MSGKIECRWPACEDDTDCMNGCKPAPATTDLVERLRDRAIQFDSGYARDLMNEAATTLEAKEKEIEALKEKLDDALSRVEELEQDADVVSNELKAEPQ